MAERVMQEKSVKNTYIRQTTFKVIGYIVKYAFLILVAVAVLFPFYWMIISSLKSLEEYRQSVPTFWPQHVLWSNYAEAFTQANLWRLFGNTVFVGIVSTILSLVITILAAFAFARLEFKGKTFFCGLACNDDDSGRVVYDHQLYHRFKDGVDQHLHGFDHTLPCERVLHLSVETIVFADTQRVVLCGESGRHERLQILAQSHDSACASHNNHDHDIEDDGRMELVHVAAPCRKRRCARACHVRLEKRIPRRVGRCELSRADGGCCRGLAAVVPGVCFLQKIHHERRVEKRYQGLRTIAEARKNALPENKKSSRVALPYVDYNNNLFIKENSYEEKRYGHYTFGRNRDCIAQRVCCV